MTSLSLASSPLAIDWLPWIAGLCVLSFVVLLLIVIAPWKQVRQEAPLDDEVEARLLLGEDPDTIEHDLEAREAARRERVTEFRPRDDR
jgi:hypothetical protein